MESLGRIELVRGEDFSRTFVLGSTKKIETSTNANPSVVTVPAHGFSTSQKKQINDHVRNTAINNTFSNLLHTITVIDANTFSVPITGIADGYGGTVLTPENLTGLVAGTGVKCQFRREKMDTLTAASSNVLFTPTLAITVAAEGTVTVTIEKALTLKDAVGGMTLDKYYGDILVTTAAGVDTIFCEFEIHCVKTATR